MGLSLELLVLVYAPGLRVKEAVTSGTSGKTSGMLTPIVLLLAILPHILRKVSIPKVSGETNKVAVEVIFRAVAVVSTPSVLLLIIL